MVKINPIDPNSLALQTFEVQDFEIIPNTVIDSNFNPVDDRIEYFIYDFNNNILSSNDQLTSFTPVRLDSEGNIIELSLNPEKDAVSTGFDSGIIKTIYNFITPELGSSPESLFYISEISPSRTEIKLNSNTISQFIFPENFIPPTSPTELNQIKTELSGFFTVFQDKILEDNKYFDEFYLNLGNNLYLLGVNTLLEVDIDNQTISLLVKLYEPLPTNIGLKSELYVVTKTGESVGYQIDYPSNIEIEDTSIKISPANYNIPIKDQTGPNTVYKTYNEITSTSLSGSLSELLSNISSSSATLTVDYTDYEDFIFFSSANERLINFKYKLTQISSSQAELNDLYSSITGPSAGSTVVSSSKLLLEKQIQTTITSFDGYEKYLYYDSGSKSWPKSNSVKPYVLVEPTDPIAIAWFDDQSITASLYDNQNQNNLEFVIPEFIRSNNSNENYMLFTNLIGQFFDEIWLYTKAITSKLDANSNIYEGVSKDLVGTVLESLGTKIYDSSFTLENIYSSIIGLSAEGATSPSTGSEYITNYVTSSIDADQVPTIDDFVKLSYKKIYHNLPYLLKKKGTNAGLRTLVNLFGVPDTILRISEFGGKDRVNDNDWDRWEHQFNYKIDTEDDFLIQTPNVLNPSWGATENKPRTIEFRFKTPGLQSGIDNPDQVLWNISDAGETAIVLNYTGSGYTSGSFSGSIPDIYNEYATLTFYPSFATDPNISASVYLPFFDGDWWSVALTFPEFEEFNASATLYAGNKIYNGSDGSKIGFFDSSSISNWDPSLGYSDILSNFPAGADDIPTSGYVRFSGSYQEIRYYNSSLSEKVVKDYVMNPQSIEGTTVNSAPDQLAFRASLGSDLYTGSISVHPKVTGSWDIINSFPSDSNFTITNGNFTTNREWVFYDQIPAGVKNIVSDKIKQLNTDLPYTGSLENTTNNKVLSSQITVQQEVEPSSSYIDDINYLEVAFSPQNEINENINSSIGYFNIGEYIGDPRLVSSSAESYPALDRLRNDYFEKYTHNYDIWDYIRLIRYYDNALFKMIKDYVPARTSLATGIVFKQHILERNKYPVPQLDTVTTTSFQHLNDPFSFQNIEVSGSPIQMYEVTGSNAGTMPELNGEISASNAGFNISPITQSWSGINNTIAGPVTYTSSTQHEFFDGELSGSEFIATNGEMNPECDPVKSISTVETLYTQSWYSNNSESGWNYQTYYTTETGGIKFWFKNTRGNIATVFGPGSWDFQIVQVAIAEETANLLDLSDKIPAATNINIPGTFDVDSFILSGWSAGVGGSLNKTLTGGPSINLSVKSVQQRTSVGDERFYLLITEPSELKFNVTNPGLFGSTGSVVVDSGSLWDETLVVLQPFVDINFFNSDCNPIINNSLNDRKDPFFFDVDYSSNAIVAVNTDSILSGSATPATVQHSNYTLARNINPRYNGSKNTGLYINSYTPSGSLYSDGENIDQTWGGDTSFGKTAVIDQYGDYALYYNGSGVGDFLNGGPNNIFLNVTFMFDQQGTVLQPKVDTPYYWNGISAFGGGNDIQLTVYNSASVTNTTLSTLQQPQTSFRAFEYHNSYLTSIGNGSVTAQNIATANPLGYSSSSMYLENRPDNGLPSSFFPTPTGSFFTTGSLSKSVLSGSVGSGGFSSWLGNSYRYRQNKEQGTSYRGTQNIFQSYNSGFDYRFGYDDPISNIAPKVGDYVYLQNYDTFGNVNTLNNRYTVTAITEDGDPATGASTYKFFIHLDRDIDGSIYNFTFIDRIPDTSKIYTNIPLSGSVVGSGFIFNQNTSDGFKNALDATLADFDVKGLI